MASRKIQLPRGFCCVKEGDDYMMNINLTLPLEEVLQKFFNKELQQLISKYQNISRETTSKLQQLLNSLPKQQPLHQLDLDLILQLLEEEYSVAVLCLWMKENGEPISIEAVKEYLREMEMEGYTETGDYILVFKGTDLQNYTKEKLLELIEDSYHVDKFFDKDQLVEMWLEETSKEDAVEELMTITNPHVELLGLEFEEICTYEDGNILMAAYKDF